MHNIIIWIIRFRRIRFVLTCCVFVFLYVTFVEIETFIKRDYKKIVKTEFDDISCYYKSDGDVLPSTEDQRFSPKYNSIFFIDSSCKEKLTMMQACVAESAAISNPQRHIYVLLSFPITDSLSKRYLAQLLTYPNVNVLRIHIAQYVKDTAVESILVNDVRQSKHPIEDTSNILKIVTLHKWGGIFLDSDMLVIRSFDDLPKNWVANQDNEISSGIISFAKDDFGSNITRDILKELAMTYDPKSKRFNRLDAIIIRVLKRICPNIFAPKSGECNGLKVFSEELFYPLRIPGPAPYLEEPGVEVSEIEIPYTYPLRSMEFSSYKSDEQWPFESLARIFCPRLFELKMSLK